MRFSVLAIFISLFCFVACHSKQVNQSKVEKPANISDDSLLTLVQYRTFQYFWEGAEPFSGLACERIHMDDNYPENDRSVITAGGSGFGVMAILVGIERGFISREEGLTRLRKNVDWLTKADRFHGAWPHWMNGETGKVKPFSSNDNGADLVETAYLMQGLLCVRQYFKEGNEAEKKLAADIDTLWREVEWSWFTNGTKDVLFWHWSPDKEWKMNVPIKGYNECLITYVLAASSPTHTIPAEIYNKCWAQDGDIITAKGGKYGYKLTLKHDGAEEYGGPLFWSHYSFLGLNPLGLKDKYANYWEENRNQTLINRQWCIVNPGKYKGYGENCWGLTASYSPKFYAAHAPGPKKDKGVISPTAAISAFPYTPEYSMHALKYFYYNLGYKIWGKYGFYDAFSEEKDWYPQQYLAIDQGPEIIMLENFRTGLLWKLFMSCPEVKTGLKKLDFSSPSIDK